MNYLALFFMILTVCSKAYSAPEDFFADPTIQKQKPEAFALQPESKTFVKTILPFSFPSRNKLVKSIQKDSELSNALKLWTSLSITEQIPFLEKIFILEVKALNIKAPQLIFDASQIPGRAAFFDFDINAPGPGRIILNPKVLGKMNKYASLSLLLHETRHSAQFQLAFSKEELTPANSVFAKGFKAAFIAQKTLPVKTFCDFLTLLNEYEAFQFGNLVLGALTDWKVSLPGMGTLASQFDSSGYFKLDLTHLHSNNEKITVLEQFNALEKDQCKELKYCE